MELMGVYDESPGRATCKSHDESPGVVRGMVVYGQG